MNIVNAFDGNKAKVGDRVFSISHGWGKIVHTHTGYAGIYVLFDSLRENVQYYKDGRLTLLVEIPDLYYGPPEIIGPEKPKRMVKEEVRLWLNIYPKSCCKITYSSRSRADSAAAPDRIACVELTGSYEVEED